MKWKIQHEGQELSKPKVCLAFKLGTSNGHMDHRDSYIHAYGEQFLPAQYHFVQDSNRRKLTKPSSRVYRRQISRIPFLIHTIALKSFRAAKFRANERTKQNRFYGLQWIDIIENEQCGISFDHDRIWDRQTSKFYLQHGTPTFYDHKLQNWQPSRTFMMEWRANSRAHSGGRPLNYSRTPFTREQINASNN